MEVKYSYYQVNPNSAFGSSISSFASAFVNSWELFALFRFLACGFIHDMGKIKFLYILTNFFISQNLISTSFQALLEFV